MAFITIMILYKCLPTLAPNSISGLHFEEVAWGLDAWEAYIKLLTAIVCNTPHFLNLPRNRILSSVLAALGGVLNSVRALACMHVYMIEPNQWQAPLPSPALAAKRAGGFHCSPSLSHTFINNHTESQPWPGGEKKERKEPFRQLLSSHAFQVTFSKGQSFQPQLHTLNPPSPLSPCWH